MLKVGDKFPKFSLLASVSNDAREPFQLINHRHDADKWKIFFFWPKNFTFVCPTEIVEFEKLNNTFQERDTILYGVSVDSEFSHFAWRNQNELLKNLSIPMLSDIKRELSTALGILDTKEGVSQRAVFITCPEGIIRFAMMTDLKVGRNPEEVLRILDALQTDELCPCNWQQGEETM